MIPGLFRFPPGLGLSFIAAIQAAGQTSNLQICLDAGDANSYGGSGQVWFDRSGNGYDFYRGGGSGSEASDPTFNGSAGGLTANDYWSFDGGDYFTYDSANETWMNALHKDSAALSVLCVIMPAASSQSGVFGTGPTVTNRGVRLDISGTAKPVFTVNDGANPPSLQVTADTALSTAAFNVLGMSINEAGSSGFFYLNGAYNQVSASDTFNAAFASPNSSDATNVMQVGAVGANSQPMVSGGRLAGFIAWNRALSKANMDSIYGSIAPRFGLS